MDIKKHSSFIQLNEKIENSDNYQTLEVNGVPIEYISSILNLIQTNSFFYTTLSSISLSEYIRSIEDFEVSEIGYSALVRMLAKNNFEKVERVSSKKEYSIRGDVISYWPSFLHHPIRLEFFDEDIESAEIIDITVNKSLAKLTTILIPNELFLEDKNYPIELVNPTKNLRQIILNFDQFGSDGIDFRFKQPSLFFRRTDLAEQYTERYKNEGYEVKVYSKHQDDLTENLKKLITDQEYPSGIISEELKLLILTDKEIFGSIFLNNEVSKNVSSTESRKLLSQFEGEVQIGDYIVHEDHGIGIYKGIIQEKASTYNKHENNYIKIEYKGNDELLVPLNMVYKITKYFGNSDSPPDITSLGRSEWLNITNKIKASVKLMAGELVRHYAKISLAKTKPIEEKDSKEYIKFVSEFEYVETPDQERSIHEINLDLQRERPMNRLLVGDVGFGKTEVIMRAAFKIVEAGGQVAVLAPTTVLVRQHEKVFNKRLKHFDFKITTLSRIKDKYENKDTIDEIKEGKVDIVIGTHRLLSNDIEFKNLRLLVIDEEQKFGVKQKEKIRKLKYGTHVLATSATPIPRTLSMALSSIQDISIIQTAPQGRKPVKTHVEKMDWNIILNAIKEELQRDGQVFFIYNRVSDISSIAHKIKSLLPGIKVAVGHGQMPGEKLDKIMSDFIEKKYDLLLSTTIIENGIDLSNVNTLVVIKAQNFGLSQLYQLRGRVGRSERSASAYFLYDGIDLQTAQKEAETEEEKKLIKKNYLKRLLALKEAEGLGSGFDLATKDLEIRGAGNLLGSEQHGNINKIGYGLYMQMLSTEIEKLKNSKENI